MIDTLSPYRIAAAVPAVAPGLPLTNVKEIIKCCKEADSYGASVILFPELALTGAGCEDLFGSVRLQQELEEALEELLAFSCEIPSAVIAGFPLRCRGAIYNVAAVIHKGEIKGLCSKYAVSSPLFTSGAQIDGENIFLNGRETVCSNKLIFEYDDLLFSVVTGEDLLLPGNPSGELAAGGAQIIFNPAAAPELVLVSRERMEQLKCASAQLTAVIATSGAGPGEPGGDFICGGRAAIYNNGSCDAENTPLVSESTIIYSDIFPWRLDQRRIRKNHQNPFNGIVSCKRCRLGALPKAKDWAEVHFDANPFIPGDLKELETRCRETLAIQSTALARRVKNTRSQKLVIGLSGGLDSTWAFLVCVECCKKLGLSPDTICAVTMPGFGTSSRTKSNAEKMAEIFGAELRIIPIGDAVTAHFKDIGHDPENHNIAYENSQARERTQILMDLANELSGMVIGTGDLSELALGWCTYNGDQMSMYGVNGSIPKTLMRSLVTFYADQIADDAGRAILKDVVDTPVSPELLPGAQHTEELVGSYDLHDFFLWHTVQYGADGKFLQKAAEKLFAGRFSREEIASALKIFTARFRTQQFKRNPMPDGAKAGTLSLSPRTDWRAPSDC
ncbi:MAG: NAD(+) synthase [Lentisphaeria bacterium]|nr:NAD(+) synthase [Lentisphaeria bacterium]